MIKITKQYFCDACGEDITHADYIGRSIEISDLNGYLFCKDCMISFNEWRKSRKNRIQNIPFSDINTKGEN